MSIKSDFDAADKLITKHMDKQIELSIRYMARHAVRNIGIPHPNPELRKSKNAGGQVSPGTGGAWDSSPVLQTVSATGDWPFRRTGQLRRNIEIEMDVGKMRGRWGTNVIYGKFLELRQRHRYPWMSKTIVETITVVRRLMSKGMQG